MAFQYIYIYIYILYAYVCICMYVCICIAKLIYRTTAELLIVFKCVNTKEYSSFVFKELYVCCKSCFAHNLRPILCNNLRVHSFSPYKFKYVIKFSKSESFTTLFRALYILCFVHYIYFVSCIINPLSRPSLMRLWHMCVCMHAWFENTHRVRTQIKIRYEASSWACMPVHKYFLAAFCQEFARK
jgi:hypothetical protein